MKFQLGWAGDSGSVVTKPGSSMTLIQGRPEEQAPQVERLTEVIPGHRPRGLVKFITSTDHKQIGINYMVTAFAFFCFSPVARENIFAEIGRL